MAIDQIMFGNVYNLANIFSAPPPTFCFLEEVEKNIKKTPTNLCYSHVLQQGFLKNV